MKYFLTTALSLLMTSTPALADSHLRASWYGPGFHGRLTASGDVYDMHGYTAAHKSLPFGTRLLVCNSTAHKCVEVVINDRGPFVGGRDIDLSFGAAKAIDLVEAGVGNVQVFSL